MVKRSLPQRLAAWLFPERCGCCGKPVETGALACASCRAALVPILPPVCSGCGASLVDCRCGKRARRYGACIAAAYYEGAGKRALLRLKFQGKPAAAELLSLLLSRAVERTLPEVEFDAVVPVPLDKKTLRKRGYNQSELLAAAVAKRLGVPCRLWLRKLYATTPQRSLPADRRRGNVLGVFDAAPDAEIRGKTLLLVDDTMTTGATLDECAGICLLYGAAAVYAGVATTSRLSTKGEQRILGILGNM